MQLLICSRAQSPTTRHYTHQLTITPVFSHALPLALSLSLFSAKGTHPRQTQNSGSITGSGWGSQRANHPICGQGFLEATVVGTAQPVRRDLLLRARMPRGPLSVSLRGSAPSLFNPSSCLNRWAANRPSCPSLEPPLGRESDSRRLKSLQHQERRRRAFKAYPSPTSQEQRLHQERRELPLRWHFGDEKPNFVETQRSDVSSRRKRPTWSYGPNLPSETWKKFTV